MRSYDAAECVNIIKMYNQIGRNEIPVSNLTQLRCCCVIKGPGIIYIYIYILYKTGLCDLSLLRSYFITLARYRSIFSGSPLCFFFFCCCCWHLLLLSACIRIYTQTKNHPPYTSVYHPLSTHRANFLYNTPSNHHGFDYTLKLASNIAIYLLRSYLETT